MVFHEIYGSYFNVVADVLREACAGTLSDKRLYEIVSAKGFAESSLEIPAALKNNQWPLLTTELKTPLKHLPQMPLTAIQKRWLKALPGDPRVRLFGLFDKMTQGLEDVTALYTQDTFHYFDRYLDGDPYHSEGYRKNFRIILRAIKEKRLIEISYTNRHNKSGKHRCFPWHIEYSSKDDKFRLIATAANDTYTVNLGRVGYVRILDAPRCEPKPPKVKTKEITALLTDERNALERAMLHFSHMKKETVRLGGNQYRLTLYYDTDDETEMLIRILSFGPMLKVISPDKFIKLIQDRLIKQKACGLT